jgi:hypothetical protein
MVADRQRWRRRAMKRTSAFPDLVTAMSDQRLFGPMFAGKSWDNWRAILRAALGLPMSSSELAFFRTVANREPPGKRVRELDIVAGRRSGKDSIASAVAAYGAATFKPDGKVRPGERPIVMLLGADRSQARSLLSYIKGFIVMDLHHLLLAGLPAHSGLPLKADTFGTGRHVSKVPPADIARRLNGTPRPIRRRPN